MGGSGNIDGGGDVGGSGGAAGAGGAGATFYGSGLNADSLANTTVGESGQSVSFRFVAAHTGTLQQIRPWLMFGETGYSKGTGGSLRIEVRPDDGTMNHLPGSDVLGSTVDASPTANGKFPLITFSSPAKLEEGQLYHLVWTNPDPDANSNFVSVNCLMTRPAPVPRQPTMSDLDFTMFHRFGTSVWKIREGYTPVLELDYADGFSHGVGYMEVWNRGGLQKISGGTAVRQSFTVSGPDRTVSRVSVRLSRESGSGDLTVRLEQADGTLVEEGRIPAGSVKMSDASSGFPESTWVGIDFTSKQKLVSGQKYNLVLMAPADTSYPIYAIRDGTGYGFKPTTVFADGYAQFNSGSGWVGWTMWGETNRKEGDLQFYFTVTP